MDTLIGKTISVYRIEQLLGKGGMGQVFLATDVNLNRQVAIKVMSPDLAKQEDFRQRFLKEAQTIAKLNNPNIVDVLFCDYKDDMLFLVMNYIPGGNLRDYLKKKIADGKQLSFPEVFGLINQLIEALIEIHAKDILHCDIKPENILLEEAHYNSDLGVHLLLADFGLAVSLSGGRYPDDHEQASGTFPYMSPEQCRGDRLDKRSDIYALGILLFELVTLKRPFNPKTIVQAKDQHCFADIPAASQHRTDLPDGLENVINKCLAKDPNDRFQNGAELFRSLRKVQEGMEENLATYVEQPQSEDNLKTHLQQKLSKHNETQIILPESTTRDRIVVKRGTQEVKTVVLTKDFMKIGRDPGIDVELDSNDISRVHAKIERIAGDAYYITDLSTNGTYLGDTRLQKESRQLWDPSKVVTIGGFQLELHLNETSPIVPIIVQPEPVRKAILSPVKEISCRLKPGDRHEQSVELVNSSNIVQRFVMKIENLDGTWFTLPKEPRLLPNQKDNPKVSFQIPNSPESIAGEYAFKLIISPITEGWEEFIIPGKLEIEPVYALEMGDLEPPSVINEGTVKFEVMNRGNSPVTCDVSLVEKNNVLGYKLDIESFNLPHRGRDQRKITIGISETRRTAQPPIRFMFRGRPLVGTDREYPFEVLLKMRNGEQCAKPGKLILQPWIPPSIARWIPPVVALGLVAFGILLSTLKIQNDSYNATRTAIVAMATATGQSLELTQIASSDSDNDGLTNNEEAQYRTKPDNPDSDNDGLADGLEVNQYGTKPLAHDSDGDTLSDGAEVNIHRTSPINPDTDGDGSPDNVDDNPISPQITVSVRPPVEETIDPATFVTNYYDLINEGNFPVAWNMLSQRYKDANNPGGYEASYLRFYKTVQQVSLQRLQTVAEQPRGARLYAEIQFDFLNGNSSTIISCIDLSQASSRWQFNYTCRHDFERCQDVNTRPLNTNCDE